MAEGHAGKMRYGNMAFSGKKYCNIGDNLQLLAIDHLYSILGVNSDEIVRIPYTELRTWKSEQGDKVVLPINFPFLEYTEGGIAGIFSNDIIPLFLGLTYIKNYLDAEEIAYLKKYEPIGCRDEYTYNTMCKYGIRAWLNGCMTLTYFECRKKSVSQNEIFLIDIISEVEDKLPAEIVSGSIKCSQVVDIEEMRDSIDSYVISRFESYKERAKLVVTSRLHCAIPCISMGIPVVLILPRVSFRFSWVERLIPIYTVNEIEDIDWSVVPPNIEFIKDSMRQNAINFIKREKFNLCIPDSDIMELSKIYMKRQKHDYYVEGYKQGIDYLEMNYKYESEFVYAVWGVTYVAQMIHKYISLHYPKARLIAAFDRSKEILFEGIRTQPIESVAKELLYDMEIFVTAWAATDAAKIYFNAINKHDKVCLCYFDEV